MKFMHSGSGNGPGAPGLWPFICTADLHREKGPPDRQTTVISRGQDRRGRRGCCPASSRRLGLLQSAAAGRNVDGCLPPCLCESQKNKPSNFRLLEINFRGAYSRFLLPSGAPSPRFANLEEQGLASGFLGTGPCLQEGTCSYGE